MPMRQKISLVLLMAASLFTMAASIVKTIITQTSEAAASQYQASIATMWTAVEQTMVIIMSCVPPLRAITKLYPSFFKALGLTDASTGQQRGSQYYNIDISSKKPAQPTVYSRSGEV